MAKGNIKRLVAERGFGFIRPEDGSADIWFHASKVKGDMPFDQLSIGMSVEYDVQSAERGPQARFVRAIAAPDRRRQAPQPTKGYRFLNPYNFVRFLTRPSETRSEQPATTLAAKLRASGIRTSSNQRPSTEALLLRRCPPPPHDRYLGSTGSITCTLEAVTPLFVSSSEEIEGTREHKSYEFFKLGGEFAIPGTSLRGMIRSVFEAVTNSCVSQLTNARLSHHLPPADALKLVPALVEREGNDNWQLRLLPGTTQIKPGRRPEGLQYAAWVPQYLSKMLRHSASIPGATPYGKRQDVKLGGREHGTPCWALIKRMQHPRRGFQFWSVLSLADGPTELPRPQADERIVEGFLCITNQNIENKHDERFFFHSDGIKNATTVTLPPSVRDDYTALILDYRQRHFDRIRTRQKDNKNPEEPDGEEPAFSRFIVRAKGIQRANDELKGGDLVYAMLRSNGEVVFIAPVSVPRVSYTLSINQLLPDHDVPDDAKYLAACKRYDLLCPACRVFGWVHQNQKPSQDIERTAYAGRVEFEDGHLVHSTGTLPPTPLAILSSPKPTTTRFYLMPSNGSIPETWPDNEATYDVYDGNRTNILRGRKFYRHHGVVREEDYYRAGGRCDDQNRTVRDALLPGARFQFTIHFQNLASLELGALLWSLELDEQSCHRLGFAKPLGFGSVKIKITEVKVLDPIKRYISLTEIGWQPLIDWRKKCVDKFKDALASAYGCPDFNSLPNVQDLRALSADPPKELPVHYPRTARRPDPEGKNFAWFVGNNRHHRYTLGPAINDTGLPLILPDGTEVK